MWDRQALFIRVAHSAPQWLQVATRYGSRENSAFSFLLLSVRISTRTSWVVSLPQLLQGSVTDSGSDGWMAMHPDILGNNG